MFLNQMQNIIRRHFSDKTIRRVVNFKYAPALNETGQKNKDEKQRPPDGELYPDKLSRSSTMGRRPQEIYPTMKSEEIVQSERVRFPSGSNLKDDETNSGTITRPKNMQHYQDEANDRQANEEQVRSKRYGTHSGPTNFTPKSKFSGDDYRSRDKRMFNEYKKPYPASQGYPDGYEKNSDEVGNYSNEYNSNSNFNKNFRSRDNRTPNEYQNRLDVSQNPNRGPRPIRESNSDQFKINPLLSDPLLMKMKNMEILYGIFPVLFALQVNRRKFHELYYKDFLNMENIHIKEILELCTTKDIKTTCISKYELKKLTLHGSVTQGLCLVTSPLTFEPIELPSSVSECAEAKNVEENDKLWLYLDGVQDPMNFGAILRTAYFFGVDKTVIGPDKYCPVTPTVSKASAGVSEVYPIHQAKCPTDFVKSLQECGWDVVCSVSSSNDQSSQIKLQNYNRKGNTLLIIGNEGHGISSELEDLSDTRLTIPHDTMCIEGMQSLNVSVATSILLYAITTLRKT